MQAPVILIIIDPGVIAETLEGGWALLMSASLSGSQSGIGEAACVFRPDGAGMLLTTGAAGGHPMAVTAPTGLGGRPPRGDSPTRGRQ